MSNGPLFQGKGDLVGLPPTGQVAYFTDASGAYKQVDSSGAVSAVGGSSSGPTFESASINLAQIGLTTLVPAVAGKKWRTDFFRIRVITNGAGLTGAASLSVGVTPTGYTDLVAGMSIGGAFPADATYIMPGMGGQSGYPTVAVATTPVMLNVTVAATGDVLTASFQIWGEYV